MGCIDENREDVASLIALRPLKDSDGQPYVPLMYTFPFGEDLGVNQDSALVRPFQKALREGKPVGKINYSFFEDNGHFFILGSFVHSPGGKIIFFPGVRDSRMIKTSEGEILSQGILHNVDHLSLESSLRVYHVTLKQKALDGSKYPRSNTLPVKDDIFHWFSMGIRDPQVLEQAPKTQEIKIKWKEYAELKRKFRFIEESRGDCKFNVTCVDGTPKNDYYINFEFFVSATRQPKDALMTIGVYHIGLSDYGLVIDPTEKIMTRSHYVELQGFGGSIWIRVSKIPGKLEQHSVFIMRS